MSLAMVSMCWPGSSRLTLLGKKIQKPRNTFVSFCVRSYERLKMEGSDNLRAETGRQNPPYSLRSTIGQNCK